MTNGGPGGQAQDHERRQRKAELGNEVDRGAEQCGVVPVEGVDEARRLHQRQRDRQVAGGLGDLLLPHCALFGHSSSLGMTVESS